MKNLKFLGLTALVMLGFPWLAVTFAPSDAGMALCFLLFFAVDPLYAILIGIFSGRSIRDFWFHPILTALLFLAGVWLLFDPGEPAFFLYAGIYFLLGAAAMGLTAFLKHKKPVF